MCGAAAAAVEFYTDSTAHCSGLEWNGSQIGSATYKLLVNFVFQLKDEASATTGYSSASLFRVIVSQLNQSQVPGRKGPASDVCKQASVCAFQSAELPACVAV